MSKTISDAEYEELQALRKLSEQCQALININNFGEFVERLSAFAAAINGAGVKKASAPIKKETAKERKERLRAKYSLLK